jgi:hypothetical protein
MCTFGAASEALGVSVLEMSVFCGLIDGGTDSPDFAAPLPPRGPALLTELILLYLYMYTCYLQEVLKQAIKNNVIDEGK